MSSHPSDTPKNTAASLLIAALAFASGFGANTALHSEAITKAFYSADAPTAHLPVVIPPPPVTLKSEAITAAKYGLYP